jgi:Pro-kumamolisin, activation domain/Secretion system C-terminal sorting domain
LLPAINKIFIESQNLKGENMKKAIRRFSLALYTLFLMIGGLLTANAQQTINGCVPQYIKKLGLHPIAQLDSSKYLDFSIGLPLRNQEELMNFLHELYNPDSPNFHHWLTPSEFASQFGPSKTDYQNIIAYAKKSGFTIKKAYSNRILIDLRGRVRDIEKTFDIKIMVYNKLSKMGTFYAPDKEPILNLTTQILNISGLSNDVIAVPNIKVTSVHGSIPTPDNGTGSIGTEGAYGSVDLRAAYAPDVTLTGSGQRVGLLQFDGYTASDITHYESDNDLPNVSLQNVLVDSATGNPSGNGGEIETTLDIEMAMAMAPGLSKIIVYEAPDTGKFEEYFEDIVNQMVEDSTIKQFSCSWGLFNQFHEDIEDPTADNSFLEMASQGQSFFQASGDGDAIINSTWSSGGDMVYSYFSFPADDPNITSVGGTTLVTSGPGGSYVSESVWNTDSYDSYHLAYGGSSGGVSSIYSIPTWQKNANASNGQVSTSYRNVPDVALTADGIYEYVDAGPIYDQGGTSCAAPLWAGFVALANQQASANGQNSIGFVDPDIYAFGESSQFNTSFHIIESGDNEWPGSGTDFTATSGYDLCTGWGTPNGQTLINNLTEEQLYVLAYQNESEYIGATSHNNNRVLATGNNLYEAFSSDGEIFVRRSTDNGTSWDITVRVSSGNGSNLMPSLCVYPISGSTDTVNVVWERSLGSDTYDIYYVKSTNSGVSWSSPSVISSDVSVSSYQIQGPEPVIAGIAKPKTAPPPGPIQPDLPEGYLHGILLVYTSSSGLYYEYSYPGYGWSSPSSISTAASGSYIWFPSLASQGGSDCTTATLTYDARYYQTVYSNYYYAPSDSFGSEAVVYDGSSNDSYDRQPSIAVNGYLYDAWNSQNSGTGYYTVKFRQGTIPNTWSSWSWTYSGSSANYYYPSICSYDDGEDVAISDYSYPGYDILLHKANMTDKTWTTYTVGTGYFPGLPNMNDESGSTDPVEVWTGSPSGGVYPITISTDDLPKQNSTVSSSFEIFNRALCSDSLRIDIKGIQAVTNSGREINVPFKDFDYSKQADFSNPWQYLETVDEDSISGIKEVQLKYSISTHNPKSDSVQITNSAKPISLNNIVLDLYNGDSLLTQQKISSNSTFIYDSLETSIPGGVLTSLKPVFRILGSGNNAIQIAFNTIDNTITPVTSASGSPQPSVYVNNTPKNFAVKQNYPNPFNPSTVISYDIPRESHVSLIIYDVIGRKVATLYDGNEKAGTYNVRFDASNLASGIYFYRLQAGNFVSTKKMLLIK